MGAGSRSRAAECRAGLRATERRAGPRTAECRAGLRAAECRAGLRAAKQVGLAPAGGRPRVAASDSLPVTELALSSLERAVG